MRIGLLREEKTPPDTRVALSPKQCVEIMQTFTDLEIVAEQSPTRCYTDEEYNEVGVPIVTDLSDCDILLGIKEVKIEKIIPHKTYLFFSHTKKKQAYNQPLMQAMIRNKIKLTDYECLTHADGQRVLGFGFFAGVVGAHNGLLTYGRRTGNFDLPAAHELQSLQAIKEAYHHLLLPPIKIVVTGSGKVASGIVEVMTMLDVDYVEPQDFLQHEYDYPVYTHLKGDSLYVRKEDETYARNDFHEHPQQYKSTFQPFLSKADLLMNGVYWDKNIPRLFEKEDVQSSDYRMFVIADITCDADGSVPLNDGSSTIADPVYGIRRDTFERGPAFQNDENVIDIMAVDNLPNELPRDASEHFGQHLIKFVLKDLLTEGSDIIQRGTICENGSLTADYAYLADYAYGTE